MIELSLLFALSALFCYGLGNTISKYPLRVYTPVEFTWYREIVMMTFYLPLFFFFPIENVTLLSTLSLIALGMTFGFLPFYLFSHALKCGSVGIVAPVSKGSVIITFLGGLLLFNESLTILEGAAVFLILIGVFSLGFSLPYNKEKENMKAFWYALATAIGWGVLYLLLVTPIRTHGAFFVGFCMELGIFLSCSLFFLKSPPKYEKKVTPHLIFAGLLVAVGSLSHLLAFVDGRVSITTVIVDTAPVVSVISGWLLFKEKLKWYQYCFLVLVFIGTALLGFF